MSEQRFCAHCAAALEPRLVEGVQRPACPRCGAVVYEDPKLVACGVVLRGGRVLLVRRALEPGRGLWSLPGGYVNRGEVVEEAAAREVREETGLAVRPRGLVGLFSRRDDPVVLAAYVMEADGGALAPSPEALEAGWFPPHALPPLAFPRDAQVIAACLRRQAARPLRSGVPREPGRP